MKLTNIHEAVSKLLGERLKKYSVKDSEARLDLVTCVKIYQDIFDTFVEIFKEGDVKICNESMNYVAQCYYDGILINNTHELDPNIFSQRAKIENIETKELALLAVLLNGTDFAIPLIHEVKRRG